MPPEVLEFETTVVKALGAAGGFAMVRDAEEVPALRSKAERVLGELGLWDLDPSASALDLMASAVACKAAGRFALPYPVAERLSGPGMRGAVAVIGVGEPRISMGDLELDWSVLDGNGRTAPVEAAGPLLRTKLGYFVSPVQLGPWQDGGDPALVLTLQSWVLLGSVHSASKMTRDYVKGRHQFGRPISSYQATQFGLADVEVSVQALEELAKYTLWAVGTGQSTALTDAVALRLAALESAELTFRASHQLHGAIGFCDETDLSWLSRHSQAVRRLPWSRSETEARLLQLVTTTPFVGLFSEEPDSALLSAGR